MPVQQTSYLEKTGLHISSNNQVKNKSKLKTKNYNNDFRKADISNSIPVVLAKCKRPHNKPDDG